MPQLLKSLVRALVPVSLRAPLAEKRRRLDFDRCLRQFCKNPESCATPDSPLLHELVCGWANTKWSGKPEFLAGCVRHALESRGPILECGSGLSTLLVGAIVTRRGQNLWTLEHQAIWAAKLHPLIRKLKFRTTQLVECELRDYGEYLWYDPPLERMPENFSLVICDGPPGHGKGGRYGLLPIMRARLAPGCIVLLDDADRETEQAVAQRWAEEIPAAVEILGSANPYIKLTLPGGVPF